MDADSGTILDLPGLADDYYSNVLDWGSKNIVAIALRNTVHLWDAKKASAWELLSLENGGGRVTSLAWAPNGQHIAIGLRDSQVLLWDSAVNKQVRSLGGGQRRRIGSLAWNQSVLASGGGDGQITINDVRAKSHVVGVCAGHGGEVCGLQWSGYGEHLASGGSDGLVHVWVGSMMASRWLHRFEAHASAAKALSWCPFQSNLLVSGGGINDRCVKLWDVHSGTCLNSVDTGSQVRSVHWNKNARELLTSHGSTRNHLTLWKHPTMAKMTELTGCASGVLYTALSPDGRSVAVAAADQTLRFYNVFRASFYHY